MGTKRGFVETFILGIADDIPSTKRLLVVARITHWVSFAVALIALLKFVRLYLGSGNMWNEPPGEVTDRHMLQIVEHVFMWLFISGTALISGFIAWLNADVLLSRKIMLEQAAVNSSTVAPAESPT